MVIFSLLLIMSQRQLVDPKIDHFGQLVGADLPLSNDLAQSRDNIVFAVAEHLGAFRALRNVQGFI